MLCPQCSKLSFVYTKKSCRKCQSPVSINIASICDGCSAKDKICSACLKRLPGSQPPRGCGCKGK